MLPRPSIALRDYFILVAGKPCARRSVDQSSTPDQQKKKKKKRTWSCAPSRKRRAQSGDPSRANSTRMLGERRAQERERTIAQTLHWRGALAEKSVFSGCFPTCFFRFGLKSSFSRSARVVNTQVSFSHLRLRFQSKSGVVGG